MFVQFSSFKFKIILISINFFLIEHVWKSLIELLLVFIIISKYSTPFCLISEIIHPWILYYRGWIISILNKKGMENLFYYGPPTPNKILEDKTNKTQHILVKTQFFFVKTEQRHIKLQLRVFLAWSWQLIRDWRKVKQENMIHIHDITIIDVAGVQ